MDIKYAPTCGLPTNTTAEQRTVEENCVDLLKTGDAGLKLMRTDHFAFLANGLLRLGPGFQSLDASKPWIVYWIVHSLDLLGLLDPKLAPRVVETLRSCQHPTGGFGGGPGQIPHLAATYAAVHATVIVGGVWPKAYEMIDRVGLQRFLIRMKQPDGSFMLHEDGEIDIRGVYCGLSAGRLVNVLTPEITHNTAKWVTSCQTYEGGLAGNPENEAHGGYAFCGLAALGILGQTDSINLEKLTRWSVLRQMRLEGGFQGRVNKLVDACYSFWVGGLFPILSDLGYGEGELLLDRGALQKYILLCCQDIKGGLIDKPGKHRDFYHTCYALSGLIICQQSDIIGPSSNRLRCRLHTLHNICVDRYDASEVYFS